jgi:hypothetical protein
MRRVACVAGFVASLAFAAAGTAAPNNPAHAPPAPAPRPAAPPTPPPTPAPKVAPPSGPIAAEIEAELAKIPIYPVMKAYYPGVYADIIHRLQAGLADGRGIVDLQAELRGVYLPLLKAQIAKADPALVVELVQVSRDQTEAAVTSPTDCMALVGLIPMERPVTDLVPRDLAERELQIDAKILQQTATHPYVHDPSRVARAPTPAQLAQLAYDALPSDDSRKRFMALASHLAQASDPADRRVVCEYMLGFFEALLKQTPEDAAAIFTAGMAGR